MTCLRKRYSFRDTACTAGDEEGPASIVPTGNGCVRRGVGDGGSVLTLDSGSQVSVPQPWAGFGAPVECSMTVMYLSMKNVE